MRSLSAGELTEMRNVAEGSMQDECYLGSDAPGGTGPDADDGNVTWADTATVSGCDASASDEVDDGSQATLTEMTIRLPLSAAVTNLSMVKVTKQHGAALATPEVYRVLGQPRRGVSVYVLKCKRVVGNAVEAGE